MKRVGLGFFFAATHQNVYLLVATIHTDTCIVNKVPVYLTG